jgi:hypothetical protein
VLRELGDPVEPSVFTSSETFVGLGVLLATGATVFVRDNRRAFATALAIAVGGFTLIAAALLARANGTLSGFTFMVAIGLGLYVPYVAVHTTVFERLVAMTRDRGNIGYLMYLADSFGYLGYVAVMFGKSALKRSENLLGVFVSMAWVTAALGVACFGCGGWWLLRRTRRIAEGT